MRWAPLLLVVACGAQTPVSENIAPALQCGEAELAVLQSPDAAALASPPPVLTVRAPEVGARPRLELDLRSTPSGAAVSLDGRLVGTTPMRLEIVDDGREHDSSFVPAGHERWKLRFAPIKDGVIHATLRPRPGDATDAGSG